MEGESCVESVGSLATVSAQFEVVAEKFAGHGMSTVVDDFVSAFHRVKTAEVSDTLVSNEDVDRVFGVVDMGYHRNDVGNLALFCD